MGHKSDIPVYGKGSNVKVSCDWCDRVSRIDKHAALKDSTSGFVWVCGQHTENEVRCWTRISAPDGSLICCFCEKKMRWGTEHVDH